MKVRGYEMVAPDQSLSTAEWMGTVWAKNVTPESYIRKFADGESVEFQITCDAKAMRWIAQWHSLPVGVASSLIDAIAILERIEGDYDRQAYAAEMAAERAAEIAEMDSDNPRNPIDC